MSISNFDVIDFKDLLKYTHHSSSLPKGPLSQVCRNRSHRSKRKRPVKNPLGELYMIHNLKNISPTWKNTLPDTNIGPENGWLEDESYFGMAYFQGRHVSFRECKVTPPEWAEFHRVRFPLLKNLHPDSLCGLSSNKNHHRELSRSNKTLQEFHDTGWWKGDLYWMEYSNPWEPR